MSVKSKKDDVVSDLPKKESASSKTASSKRKRSKDNNERKRSIRFTRDRVNALGQGQGRKYLALAVAGLFVPPLAPAAWLLSSSLRSLAKASGYLLDNRVYAAWVLGLVSTVFYGFLLILILCLYLLVPGYSFL